MNKNYKQIRSRFAPSPTGLMHIGVLRTALYAYLFAKRHGGDFILRIEDTDKSREVEGGVENIIETLEWAGLEYEEGVAKEGQKLPIFDWRLPIGDDGTDGGDDVETQFVASKNQYIDKGPNGPYMQSKRLEIYKKYVQELVDRGKAYYCFCTPERLDEMRKKQMAEKKAPKYDGLCKKLSREEAEEKLREGVPHVIRLDIPKEGETEFEDLVRGKVSFKNELIDHQVLMKSDGYPTYHLANVVDDHLMCITHVLRGEEWLPSTPKHIILYQAFGWGAPQFAHLPQLLNKQKKKLSKREGDVSVQDFIKKGYLKEALLNFIALLGWNPGDDREIFTIDELIKEFDIKRVHKAGAVFDTDKLDYINGYYIRKMDLRELTRRCVPFLVKGGILLEDGRWKMEDGRINNTIFILKNKKEITFEKLQQIVRLEQERVKTLSEVGERVKFVFADELEYEPELLVWKKSDKDEIKENLIKIKNILEKIPENNWLSVEVEKNLQALIKEKGAGSVLWPLRVALTGQKDSPGPFEVAEVLGREESLERLQKAIEKL